MLVKYLKKITHAGTVYPKGEVIETRDDLAMAWIKAGRCEKVEEEKPRPIRKRG